jgi:hypothetical protein
LQVCSLRIGRMGTWMATIFPKTLPPGADHATFTSGSFEVARMTPKARSGAVLHHSLRGVSG